MSWNADFIIIYLLFFISFVIQIHVFTYLVGSEKGAKFEPLKYISDTNGGILWLSVVLENMGSDIIWFERIDDLLKELSGNRDILKNFPAWKNATAQLLSSLQLLHHYALVSVGKAGQNLEFKGNKGEISNCSEGYASWSYMILANLRLFHSQVDKVNI